MRLVTVSLVVFCSVLPSCSSSTDPLERDLAFLEYSLSEVDGSALPGPASSLPGLVVWEGTDDTILTVALGGLSCLDTGVGEETYLFRLSKQGSATWDPIRVTLSLSCETTGSRTVRFRNNETGEVIDGDLQERFDGCAVIVKNLPNLASLKAGYESTNSGAVFPAELAFPGAQRGQFLAASCMAM